MDESINYVASGICSSIAGGGTLILSSALDDLFLSLSWSVALRRRVNLLLHYSGLIRFRVDAQVLARARPQRTSTDFTSAYLTRLPGHALKTFESANRRHAPIRCKICSFFYFHCLSAGQGPKGSYPGGDLAFLQGLWGRSRRWIGCALLILSLRSSSDRGGTGSDFKFPARA